MLGCDRRLAARASSSKRRSRSASAAQPGGQRLDGDVAAEPRVARPMHLAHPAGANQGPRLVGAEHRASGDCHSAYCCSRHQRPYISSRRRSCGSGRSGSPPAPNAPLPSVERPGVAIAAATPALPAPARRPGAAPRIADPNGNARSTVQRPARPCSRPGPRRLCETTWLRCRDLQGSHGQRRFRRDRNIAVRRFLHPSDQLFSLVSLPGDGMNMGRQRQDRRGCCPVSPLSAAC